LGGFLGISGIIQKQHGTLAKSNSLAHKLQEYISGVNGVNNRIKQRGFVFR